MAEAGRDFAILTPESVIFGAIFCLMLTSGREVEAFRWSFKPAWNFQTAASFALDRTTETASVYAPRRGFPEEQRALLAEVQVPEVSLHLPERHVAADQRQDAH